MGRVVGWVDGASTVYSRAKLIAARVPHTEPIGRREAALGRGSCPSAGTAPDAALDARREARAAPSGSGSWLGGTERRPSTAAHRAPRSCAPREPLASARTTALRARAGRGTCSADPDRGAPIATGRLAGVRLCAMSEYLGDFEAHRVLAPYAPPPGRSVTPP